jgi:hypothetical protein
MSTLARLEACYLRQCNGDWEHLYGITIETLDNAGWSVTIDLTLDCRGERGKWKGTGGTLELNQLLEEFCRGRKKHDR